MWLAGDSARQWGKLARDAVLSADELHGPNERDFASALALMADGAYYRACDHYRAIAERNATDTDPIAWFGLGECLSKDSVLVEDATSPSGYHFRSSRWSATEAYRKALIDVPSFNFVFQPPVYPKLAETLFAGTSALGVEPAAALETNAYIGIASWQRDSMAFVPEYISEALHPVAGSEPIPASQRRAQLRSREILAEIVTTWERAYPTSAEARAARALALEVLERFKDSHE